jgi:hypothetical protein
LAEQDPPFTKKIKGWAKNLSGFYKKEKCCLLGLIDRLDLKADCASLKERK